MQEESPRPTCFIQCSQLLHRDREWPVPTHTLCATQNFADIYHTPPKSSFFQAGKLVAWTALLKLHHFCHNSNLVLSHSVLVLVLWLSHSLRSSACRIGIIKITLSSCTTVVTQWSTSIKATQNTLFSEGLAKDSEKQQFHISRTRENSINVNRNKPMVLSTLFHAYLATQTDENPSHFINYLCQPTHPGV